MTEVGDRTSRRNSTQEIATSEGRIDIDEETTQAEFPENAKISSPPKTQIDMDMDGLTGAMSSLKFVPPSVRFGRGRGRGRAGFSRT